MLVAKFACALYKRRSMTDGVCEESTGVVEQTNAEALGENVLTCPRSLAQDAVNWYMEQLDPHESHSTNIKTLLRPAVLSLSCFVLHDKKRHSWKDYLPDSMLSAQNDNYSVKLATLQQQSTVHSLDRRNMARMDAFLNGIIWAVPDSTNTSSKRKLQSKQKHSKDQTLSIMNELSGFNYAPIRRGVSLLSSVSSGAASTPVDSDDSSGSNFQIRPGDLRVRLELYLRDLVRVAKSPLKQPCVLCAEPPRALKARVHAIVTAFSETVGTVRQQAPVLTRLITFMTMELLAVSCLGESCKRAIRRVVLDYEHQTSFASLAFLSSPEDAAGQNLTPLLHRYFANLKEKWQTALQDCELEELLQNVLDPEMRSFFKTVEFTSIGHLLETCASYRSLLQSIELPPQTESSTALQIQDCEQVRQAIRDLQRERITINGSVLPPVKSRSELVRMISQTLESTSLTPKFSRDGSQSPKQKRRSRRRKHGDLRRADSEPDLYSANVKIQKEEVNHVDTSALDDATEESSAHESETSSLVQSTIDSSKSSRRVPFDVSTIDMLTRRLLLASSRTGIGGDAYFIIKDLFGGRDVQVLPSQDLRGAGGTPATTLELWLHLSTLTIQCHASFDVYPLLKDHGNDPYAIVDYCEPLIQLHTTTTEVIYLHEVRASDARPTTGVSEVPSRHFSELDGHFVLQERITPRTGWRTLSIRPALYEKLQVWTTPS